MEDHTKMTIAFFFMFLLILTIFGLGYYFLYLYHQESGCVYHPDIRCDDNWTCNGSCPGPDAPTNSYSKCFINLGPTGLASCLFGPHSTTATACYFPPSGTTKNPACECSAKMREEQINCFSGCASTLGQAPDTCCQIHSTSSNCTGS